MAASYQCYVYTVTEGDPDEYDEGCINGRINWIEAGPAVYYRPEDAMAAGWQHSVCLNETVYVRDNTGVVIGWVACPALKVDHVVS